MREHRLKNDLGNDIEFEGELVKRISSRDWHPHQERWTELHLFKTKKGTWVCQSIGASLKVGETTFYHVHVAKTDSDLVSQLGDGWLASRLYEAAGVDATTRIE